MEDDTERIPNIIKGHCNDHSSLLRSAKHDCTFTWTIYDFNYIFKDDEDSSIQSPTFTSGCYHEYRWDLNLYPFGYSESSDYIDLTIYKHDNECGFEVSATCLISIIDKNGKKVNTTSISHDFSEETCKILNFIKKEDLLNKKNGYLINNRLVLLCEMKICIGYEIYNADKIVTIQDTKNKLQVSEDLISLLDGKLHDVVFIVSGKEYLGHKSVLACRSPVFSVMFEHQMLEKVTNIVEIKDISCFAFQILIEYIYSGTIKNIEILSESILTELLMASDKYELRDLEEICTVMFYKTLTLQNAIKLLAFADTYNAQSLKEQVIQFIIAHNKEFINNSEYEALTISHPHLLPNFIEMHAQRENELKVDFYMWPNIYEMPLISTPVKEEGWGVSQVLVYECNYTWEIQNYSIISNMENISNSIWSERFKKGNDKISWQLILFPKGVNKKTVGFISLFVYCLSDKDEKEEIQAKYEFHLVNSKGKTIKKVKSRILIFMTRGEKLGEDMFLKNSFLLNEVNEVLVNDTLIIKCKISYSTSHFTTFYQEEPLKYCLPKYLLNISKDLEGLLKNSTFSDLTVSTGSKTFKIHRVILLVRCPSFLSHIDQLSKGSTEQFIRIWDIEEDVLEQLLLFIYSGVVRNLKKSAKDLYTEANKYELEGLRSLCEIFLCENITKENVCDYFLFAHLNRACKLRNETAECIIKNLSSVVGTVGYQSLANSRPQLLKDIILKLEL